MQSQTHSRLVIGSASDSPDIEYRTGFRPVDAVVMLVSGGKQFLVVPGLEYGRALKAAPKTEVYTPEMLGLRGRRRRGLSAWAAALLKKQGVKRVAVAPFFYVAAADRLRRSGVKLDVSTGILFPERAVKSPDEINKITAAQQAAVIAMRHAVSLISRSTVDHAGCLRLRGTHLTSERVIDAVTMILIEHRCLGRNTIVAGGTQGADPHETGHGNLKAGQPIVIDIFPQHLDTGYWGDITRTVLRGKATPAQKKVYNAVRASQAAALNLLKPGVTGDRVHRAACAALVERGLEIVCAEDPRKGFIHSTGHGVGLCIHEGPVIAPGAGRLKKGQVVTVEPGYYDPATAGCRIEDTIVLVPNGWRYLVPCEKRFEV